MKEKMIMKSEVVKRTIARSLFVTGTLALVCLVLLGTAALRVSAQTVQPEGPKLFATPTEAAEALFTAAEAFDDAAFNEIFGPGNYDIIHTGEPVADRQIVTEFAKLGREKTKFVADKKNRRLTYLSVGNDDWPFPIPLVKKGAKWYFDAAAGRQEILYRRVGRNELDAIQICRGFVEAQHEYALEKHDGAPVNQYAHRIISTPGRQDGLAWLNAEGKWEGPIGENIAKAIERGYTDRTSPYHGYFFKVLKGQGPAAPLGKMDFEVNGYLIGGFALIAFPSQYQVTGVKTFMVSHDGVVYEKDLGPKTADVVKSIDLFNPDRTWSPVLKDDE